VAWAGSRTCAFGTSPVITTSSLPGATAGVAYSATLAATGGRAPYTWAAASLLPNTGGALSFSASGVLSGIPTTAETEVLLNVVARDSAGLASAPVSLSVVVAPAATGFDYYIGLGGNDANPGTLASPWAITSLLNPRLPTCTATAKANQALMQSKRIGLIAGTYTPNTVMGSLSNLNFQEPVLIVPKGTPAAFTYLASCDATGAYSARASIINFGLTDTNNPAGTGEPAPGIGGSDALGTGYTIIDGLELTNTNDQIVMLGSGNNVTNLPNHIRNCYIHGVNSTTTGANSAGITAYSCNGSIIENNKITNIVNSSNRNTAIELWGCRNCILQYNTIVMANAGSAAIYIKNQTPQTQFGNTIRYNYADLSAATSLGGAGVYGWDITGTSANTSVFHHNIALGIQSFREGLAGVSNQSQVENQQFYNNTFVTPTQFNPGSLVTVGSGPVLTYYNNIHASPNSGFQGVFLTNSDNPVLIDYNLYQAINNGLNAPGSGCAASMASPKTTLATWQAAIAAAAPSCIGKEAHALTGTPTFVGGTPALPAQAWQLTSGSIGHLAGSSTGQVGGTAIDMGAWGGTDVNTGQPIAQIGSSF